MQIDSREDEDRSGELPELPKGIIFSCISLVLS